VARQRDSLPSVTTVLDGLEDPTAGVVDVLDIEGDGPVLVGPTPTESTFWELSESPLQAVNTRKGKREASRSPG
jgi:hypothetical protein